MQAQLDNAFATLNAHIADRQMNWAKSRQKALIEKVTELWPVRRQMGEAAYYDEVFAVAGGKTWYNIFNGRNWQMVSEIVAKNIAALIAKRDAQIIKALNKAGITEIPEFELVEVSDGIEGTFYIADHKVTIRTILAGGYNVQCLHMRTLVKVK